MARVPRGRETWLCIVRKYATYLGHKNQFHQVMLRVFILARRDGALSYFYIDAPIERKKGGWMRITLISLVVDLSKNEAVSLYTAQGTICYSIFKRFYRLDSASSPKYHRVQYFIYRVDGEFSRCLHCAMCVGKFTRCIIWPLILWTTHTTRVCILYVKM